MYSVIFKGRCVAVYLLVIVVTCICVADKLPDQSSIEASRVVLSNDIVRFEFETKHMGLIAMIDYAAGVNHIQPVDKRYTLWELTFYGDGQKRSLSSTQVPCTSYKIEKLTDGLQRATFEWSDMDLEGEKEVVKVWVTVDIPQNTGIASWSIWVDNNSKALGLYEVEFPKFRACLKSGEYDIAVPTYNWGTLFKNCREELSYRYPYGWSMPMQFLCAMKETNAVYIAAHDPHAWDKNFVLEPGKEFYVRTKVENMGVPGSDHKAPFVVMVGVYRGSWMEACKIYRKFAITAPWTSEGKASQRKSMPQALKDIGLWMLMNRYIGPDTGTLEEKNKPLIDAQRYFEVPIGAHWYNWHKFLHDTRYPHYFPTKPGIPDQARDLVSRALVIMPYINGRIIDISNEDFKEYFPYCAKDKKGKHYVETYNKVKNAPMCSYTEFWQNKVVDIVERLAEEVGVNAVYIDQIAAGHPAICFDKTHGHPLGGGGWWVDGYRKMLKKVQKVAHEKGRDMIITTECVAEPFMDGVDAFLAWVRPDDRSIPMTAAVYSGYTIYFGSPASFQHGDRGWIMAQGRAFLWGSQNGWMQFELFKPEHAKKAAFLKKVGKCRLAGKKFLTYGELVDLVILTNHVETITEVWPDHENNKPRNATLSSIQGTIWRAEDGTLGIFLVNYLEKENTVEFQIDPDKYGLGGSAKLTITRIRPEKNHVEKVVPYGPISRTQTLGPWEICMLEIKGS